MAGTAVISTIKHDVSGAAPTFRDGAGNEIGQLVKSWVSYNGVTPAVRGSFNVSSVTKDGTGRYTPFFTNTLSDANYSIQMTVAGTGSYSDWSKSHWYTQSTITSSYFQTQNVDEGDSYYDTNVSLAVFR